MYALVLRLLSGAALLLAVLWFFLERGFEPVITAIAGLIGLLTATRVDSNQSVGPGGASHPEAREGIGAVLVLPFEDLSPASDSGYLGAGIADELITRLSQINGLRVINRTSSRKFAEAGSDAAVARSELGAAFMVEGGVRRSNERLRVTAQVTNTAEGDVLWSDTFDGSVLEAFDFQELIADRTAAALNLRLSAAEEGELHARPIEDPKAYDYFLRARYRIYEMSAESAQRALQELAYGLQIEGENVEILKAMALATYQQINIGSVASDAGLPRLSEFVDRISALDPNHVAVPLINGLAAEQGGDTRRTVQHLRTARNRDATDPDATFWLTVASFSTGQVALGRCLAREMARRDPLNPFPVFFDAYGAFFEGRALEGVPQLSRSLDLGGREVPAILWAGVRILCAAGDREAAGRLLDDLRLRHPDAVFTPLTAAFLAGLHGDPKAGTMVQESHRSWAKGVAEWAQFMGDLYAVLGEEDEALEWLGHAQQVGFLNERFVAEGDPFLAPLRDHEDYIALVESMRSDRADFETTLESVQCAG